MTFPESLVNFLSDHVTFPFYNLPWFGMQIFLAAILLS